LLEISPFIWFSHQTTILEWIFLACHAWLRKNKTSN
jgi:hypothetical protein